MEDCRNFPFPTLLSQLGAPGWPHQLLDYTLQPCKPCACPASRPKKEPGVSNRNINDFMDRVSLPFWSKVLEQGPGATLHLLVQQTTGRTNMAAASAPWEDGVEGYRCRGIDIWWAPQLPGKLTRGTPLTTPLISYSGGDVLL